MSRFPAAESLACRAGLAPGGQESAGKRTAIGAPHGTRWLTARPVEAAGSVGRRTGAHHLSAQFAQRTTRRGRSRAAVAVAGSILVSAYFMLTGARPSSELGADWLRRRNDEAHTRRLIAQLERARAHRDPRPGRLTRVQNNRGTGFARPR